MGEVLGGFCFSGLRGYYTEITLHADDFSLVPSASAQTLPRTLHLFSLILQLVVQAWR